MKFKETILTTIEPYIFEKKVLDVGCVEHELERIHKKKYWVHDFIREHAKEVIGIDILKKECDVLRGRGYDIVCQNAESFHFLPIKFDVIFAGELIEHLSNPGLFLERCLLHLKKDGLLIMTTPSAYSTKVVFSCVRLKTSDPDVNSEHTCWYSPTTIKELLRRYNFEVTKVIFVDGPIGKNFKIWLRKRLESYRGADTKETMIVIAKHEYDEQKGNGNGLRHSVRGER